MYQAYRYRSRLGGNMWEGVLQFRNFQLLLQEHRIEFPSTTVGEIDDRSKGDALSKGIALLQITWFIIQLTARRIQGLTITELELTTAALAGLNSVMYVFWWNKPLDVRCPNVIHTKAVDKLLAERAMGDHEWTFQQPCDFRLGNYLRERYVHHPLSRIVTNHLLGSLELWKNLLVISALSSQHSLTSYSAPC